MKPSLLRRPMLLAPCLALAACVTPAGDAEDGAVGTRSASADTPRLNLRMHPARSWTTAFVEDRILVADQVEVHGPVDLLEHLAVKHDPETFDYETVTTPAGLRQEITRKPELRFGEAHAQLDNWKLVALRRMVIVQAPDDVPVRIVATGQAAFLGVGDGAPERRAERLTFVGEHGR